MQSSLFSLMGIILPSGAPNENLYKTKENLELLCERVIENKEVFVDNSVVNTDYYLFLFDNEQFDGELLKAIPVFLGTNRFDALCFYRKMLVNHIPKIDRIPRCFKKHVALKNPGLCPVDEVGLVWETVLDGWIVEHK